MDGGLSATDGSINENSVNSTVDDFLANLPADQLPSFIVSADSIPDSEIIISDDNSPEAIGQYYSQLNIIFAKYFSTDFEGPAENNNFTIATKAIETKNFSRLELMIKSYTKFYQDLKQISVPSTWKNIHKKYLAIMLSSANVFESIKQINDDPLKTYIALQQYSTVNQMFIDIIAEVTELTKK